MVAVPCTEIQVRAQFDLGTVVLPKPVFNDREILNLTRVQRVSTGGYIFNYQDINWYDVEKLKYQFEELTQAKKDEYETFVHSNLGLVVTIITHENKTYTGIIDDVSVEMVKQRRTCGWAVGFEFFRLT